MNKVIVGMVVIGTIFVSFFGLLGFLSLKYSPSTTVEESSCETVTADILAEEEERLNYTYTISDIYRIDFCSEEGEMRYKIVFEEISLDKVNNPYVTFRANEEFGSKLSVGQKLTVKEIEENLGY